ncbi:MAG: multiple antibiotic resistance protein [Phormidesmis priestleyi Ana]|uniref:UPF0056 membrane protein n=1 Tax=Phormidesmis priestleyi Ana TaxID=1666911 RepID=A0A0P8DDY4_9CYAN|nr:MAG: multiple antibiotic resistance protein [Phormidesmis priestleyi Ana]
MRSFSGATSYAKRIAINVISLLVIFLLIGGGILRFFGVSLEVVRIAGGIVVFHAAWNTMNAESKISELENEDATQRADQHEDISFMPMTIPLLAGPGAIAVVLGLAAEASRGAGTAETAVNLVGIAIAISLIGLIIYIALRASTLLLKWLGAGGIHALSRILGLFVMAIGVQLILNGLSDWVRSLNP